MKYTISTDKEKLDTVAIHDYLCNQSYWAKGRSFESVKKSMEHSICFGMYDNNGKTIGFARVVSDHVVFAYLMDLFIFDEYRGKGLGKQMLKYILGQPELQVRLWFLATANAHGLYKQFGFSQLEEPERFMLKRDINYT